MVIVILILVMTKLPPVIHGPGDAAVFACKCNLKKLYDALIRYQDKNRGMLPAQSGPKFLLALWTSHVLDHTESSRDLFLCPGLAADPELVRLRQTPLAELWARIDDVSGRDTHYAGRNHNDKSLIAGLGLRCLAADDNEGGSNHSDGTVNYLMGDGAIREAQKVTLVEQGLMTREQSFIPVGPESPVTELRHVIAR